jgi:hypothetical protein
MDRSLDRRNDADVRWLARWGAFVAIAVGGLLVTYCGTYVTVVSRPDFGGDLDELLMAAYAPVTYRLAMAFDALGWLAMGGLIVLTGWALRGSSPILSRLGILLGGTAAVGIAGGLLRLTGIGHLGASYLDAGAGQAGVQASFHTLELVIGGLFDAGDLTMGLGFLCVGLAALATSWFPRSAAWLLLLPAATSLTLLAGEIVLDAFLFPVVLVHVVLLAACGLVLARRWWATEAVSGAAVTARP